MELLCARGISEAESLALGMLAPAGLLLSPDCSGSGTHLNCLCGLFFVLYQKVQAHSGHGDSGGGA